MQTRYRSRQGVVVSNKMDQTVVVAVKTQKRHPLYKKTYRRTIKYKAHDKDSACGIGDVVKIVETRPLSKEKRWRVAEVVAKGEEA